MLTQVRKLSHRHAWLLSAVLLTILVGACALRAPGVSIQDPIPSKACSPQPNQSRPGFETYAYFALGVTCEARAQRLWRGGFLSALLSPKGRSERLREAGDNWQQAADYFQQVLQRYPECGPAYAHLGLGYLHFRKRQEALPFLRLASRHDPDNLEVHLKLGLDAERSDRLEEATTEYEKALAVPEGHAKAAVLDDVYLRLARLYERQQAPERAVLKLRELLALVQELPRQYAGNRRLRTWSNNAGELYLKIARLLMSQDQPQAALTELLEAKKRSANDASLELMLARVHSELGHYPQAAEACESYLKRTPSDQSALMLLADIHERVGDSAKAEEVYHRLLDISSSRVAPYERLVERLASRGESADALTVIARGVEAGAPWEKLAPHMDELIDKAPTPAATLDQMLAISPQEKRKFCFYFICGRLSARSSKFPVAADYYRKSINSYPLFPPTYAYLTLVHTKMGNRADAIAVLKQAQRRRLSLPHLHEMLGQLYYEENEFKQAVAAFKEEIDRQGDNPMAHFHLGLAYERLRNFLAAREQYEQALNLDPENPLLLSGLATFFLRHNERAEEAASLIRQALEREPDNVEHLMKLAWAYSLLRKRVDADKLVEQAGELARQDPETHYIIASVLHRMGRKEQVEAKLRFILTLDSAHPPSNNDLGYLYAEAGKNLAEAEVLIKWALEKDTDNAAYIDSLGWVYFKQGRSEEALVELQRASLKLQDPEILEHLGDVLEALERPGEAEEAWRKALELDPERESLKDKLQQLDNTADHN